MATVYLADDLKHARKGRTEGAVLFHSCELEDPMIHRVSRISVLQTSKFVTALYLPLWLLIIPFGLLIDLVAPVEERIGLGLWVAFSIGYMVLTFFGMAFGCWLYNVFAARLGGVEITLESQA